MMKARTLLAVAAAAVCVTHTAEGQDLSQYRRFELGSNMATVSARAAIATSGAKTLHTRPAMLQDLEWRPSRWPSGATTASTDPVEQVRFSFINNQLYRLIVDYSSDRTEGMTEADLIAALATEYGAPVLKTMWRTVGPAARIEAESGAPVARWEDAGHMVVLYRTATYRASYRMLMMDTRLRDLAFKAETEALRLDTQEAPGREMARQKKERDDGRAATEKARTENKGTFRP